MPACSARLIALGVFLTALVALPVTAAAPLNPSKAIEVEAAVRPDGPARPHNGLRMTQSLGSANFYGGKIVIADSKLASSKQLAPAIEDLRKYLGEITGTEFTLGSALAGPAIILSQVGSPPAPMDAAERL